MKFPSFIVMKKKVESLSISREGLEEVGEKQERSWQRNFISSALVPPSLCYLFIQLNQANMPNNDK